MIRFLFRLTLILLVGLRSASAEERANVLFISLDDMNDWLGCYGGHPDAITPNIDRLAERGVRFTNAHCVSPICGPSRASVLTGLRPETSGVYHNKGTYIDYVPDAVTFPEHFRTNGYRTLAAGKVNHNLGEPDPRLWDENGPDCGILGTPFIDDELHTAAMKPERVIDRGSLQVTLPANGGLSAIDRPTNTWDSFDWAPLDCPETDFPDRQIADWGVDQLSKPSDQPMLLALGFYKPHQPFFAPREYFDLYDAENVRLPSTIAGDLYDVPQPGRELATRAWTSGTHKTVAEHGAWREAVHGYLATVSFVDALVGRVVEALDAGPHADNTWIILWSDHGWSLGEKEHWGKHVPWREGVRMPLMIVPPKQGAPEGFEPGTVCEARVSLLDLYPTLIDACGLPDRDELEGRSLVPLVGEVDAEWSDAAVATIGRGTHSVSTGDWRYIRYFDGSEELYDLKRDPREWFNLAAKPEHAERKRRLAGYIPEDDRFRQFVGWGRWKCVFPVEGDPMLFDYQGDFGISEQTDVAAENPQVIADIRAWLEREGNSDRRVAIPEESVAPSASSGGAGQPNLVFIVVDDAGYDDFGFTGCEDWQTPRIDSIARDGVIFTDGYVTASVCGPSRAGLITGRYQQSFGHEENITGGLAAPVAKEDFGLPLDVPTLGNLLQEKGYATAAFGKWHLGEYEHFHPNERGFDHFVGFLGGHRSFWPLEGEGAPGHRLMVNDEVTRTPEDLTDHLGSAAADFVAANADKPFFLYLAYNAVHSPLQATEEDLQSLAHIEDEKRRVLGAMTLALDRSVGHVLDSLKEQGIEKDTVVVFTNDNGAATYLKTNNGGLRGRKGTVWEGGLRVPFSVSWPGMIDAGTECRAPVNTLDVGYTFCRVAGHSDEVLQQRKFDGGYLLDVLREDDSSQRELFWRRGNTAAIRKGDWKLITLRRKPAFLFNVATDPKETENLIAKKTERAGELMALLSDWDQSLPTPQWRKKASDSYDEFLLKYWDEN